MRTLRVGLCLLIFPSALLAQASTSTPWLKETFKSGKLGEDRTIYIATPANYSTSSQRYPVLVLLDANDEPQWAAAVANVAFLSSRGAIPDLLVIGVTNGKDRSTKTEISTGITLPRSDSVAALYALQNSMMLTPCWPSAGPTGGAGLAAPAGTCSLMSVRTFLAMG